MKLLTKLILLPGACFLLTFCNNEDNVQQESITGKWQLVEQKVDIGPPGEWTAIDNGDIFIFNDDSSFSESAHPHCTSGMYNVIGDTLRLNYNCLEYDVSWDFRLEKFSPKSFTISPITVMCTEGCSLRYKKID